MISIEREFLMKNNDKVIFKSDGADMNSFSYHKATGERTVIVGEIRRRLLVKQPISFSPKSQDKCRELIEERYPNVRIFSEKLAIKQRWGSRILEMYFYSSSKSKTYCKLVTDDTLDMKSYESDIQIGMVDDLVEEALSIANRINIEYLEAKWGIKERSANHE